MMIRSLVLVLLLAVCGKEVSAQRNRQVNPGGLATAVAKYPITFGIENPAELLGILMSSLGPRLQREDLVETMLVLNEELMFEYGFALNRPTTWLKTGINPMAGIRGSVLGFGGWLGLPNATLFSAGVRDPEAFVEYVNKHSGSPLRATTEKPAIYAREGGRDALGFLGGRAYFVSGPDAEGLSGTLRGILGDQGRARTLAADQAFDLVKKSGSESLPLALFFNFAEWEPLRDNPEFHLPSSVLLALGPEGLVASAALAKNSPLLALKPGADSQKFLARFDRPTFAFSVSLSKGLKDLRDVIAELTPVGLPDLDQVVARLPDLLGMNAGDFARQMDEGSGGMLFYPGAVGQKMPDLVLYLHLQDSAAMRKQFAPGIPHGGREFELHRESDGQYLVRSPDFVGEMILGVVDDYLLISNSRKRIDRMAKGEAKGWQPRIGGKQLLAAELNPEGIAELLEQSHMGELAPFVSRLRLFGQLQLKPGGLLARVEPFGDRSGKDMVGDFLEACLLLYGKEMQPREPEFELVPWVAEKPNPNPNPNPKPKPKPKPKKN